MLFRTPCGFHWDDNKPTYLIIWTMVASSITLVIFRNAVSTLLAKKSSWQTFVVAIFAFLDASSVTVLKKNHIFYNKFDWN
jgi:hypothetical protein